jgi:hypothetical protein
MKRILLIALLCAGLLVGCVQGTVPSVPAGDTEVEVADTPVPPTNTPVPPTPTPIPPTPTPILDLNAVLVDAGFAPTNPLLPVGFMIGDLLEVTDSASYEKSAANEFVHTIVFPLPTQVEVAGFSLELADPNYTLLAIVAALNGAGIDSKVDLGGATTVGEISKGVTFTTNIGGATMRLDVVLFKEGANGAIVVVVRPDGAQPTVDAWTVAQKLDERIKGQ